jgi:glycosyltransferase involved in cell wall biosynthesis
VRVLLISKEFPPYSPSGGIGTYTRILSAALADEGLETHVLCVHPGLPRDSNEHDGVVVHTGPYRQIRGAGRLTRLPATWGRLSHALSVWREYKALGVEFDVIEAPELYAESLLVGRRSETPLVVRMHSGAAQLFPLIGRTGPDARLTIALENAAIRRADVVVSTAPHLAAAIAELGLIGVATRAIIYPVTQRPGAPDPPEPPVVLFVGRLERQKGPEVLIEAAPRVLEAVPDARFRFVGSDTRGVDGSSYRTHLESFVNRLGIADSVEFRGPVSPERVFEEMVAASVCAFPSRWESFGNVAAESGSIGRAVVVSDIPAFRDYVEDGVNGRIAPVEDPKAWADALCGLLLDRSSSKALGGALRETLRTRAAPATVAAAVIESYEEAIARKRAGA